MKDGALQQKPQQRQQHARSIVKVLALLVASICVAILICWLFGTAELQLKWPGVFVMKANTAVTLLLFAMALIGLQRRDGIARFFTTSIVLIALAITLITILEYVLGAKLKIDQMLVVDHEPLKYPGRMSLPTCVSLMLFGIAMLLSQVARYAVIPQLLFLASAAIPLSAFGGHLYNAPGLASSTRMPIVSLQTAVGQLMLAVGGMLARPDEGLMRAVMSNSLAGSTSRKLLPLAIVLPILAGLFINIAEQAGWISVPFGSALLVSTCALLFAGGVWSTTLLLWQTETKRAVVEALQRQSDARYLMLFNSIDQGFCVIKMIFDDAGRPMDYLFLEVNPAFETQTGLKDAVGKRMRDMAPAHENDWYQIYGGVAKTGKPVLFEREGAHGRWFNVHATRVDAPSDHHVAIALTDISDRRANEEEILKSREMLSTALDAERLARAEAEAAGRIKDDFLATLSHELRTPLNAIVGWIQIIKRSGNDPKDIAEGVEVIDRNARAQAQIIEDILDMSRIVSGKLRLDVQRVDLAALVEAAAATMQPAADVKAIRLQLLIDPVAGPINGDPNRLQQVFWNLISNAIKFTPKGGRVQVLVQRINSHVEVSVIDTGEGIDLAFLPYVFERFRQADSSTTRRHGGLGLGLAIVKQLMELHGGSVQVRSPGKGEGSTFIVMLPLTVLHPEVEERQIRREHPTAEISLDDHHMACDQLGGLNVLVVDDEQDGRAMVKRFLEECGAQVQTAASAKEALEMIRAKIPQVLISDIGMPGEDGYWLIKQVRCLPSECGGTIRSIALTAYARAADRVKALEAGFQMHLAKPVESVELVVTVAALAKLS